VRALHKVYGDVVAVNGISFALEKGSVTALLGGNGAGKTTTISMLMGLVVPTSGEARVFGVDMARERHQVLHRMNFESPYVDVPMRLTVRQNLEIFARLYGVRDLKGRVRDIADDLRLTELLDRRYGKLSAGQKTRVSLAKSLLNEPELLLLDEPTAGLDLPSRERLIGSLDAMAEANPALPTVTVTHHLEEIPSSSTHALLLADARIVAQGPIAEVMSAELVSRCFGIEVEVAQHGNRWAARVERPAAEPLG
jgi:ABC-2 type transport system ATP-binding protein